MAHDSRRTGEHAADGQPRVRDLQTYFRIFRNLDLSRVYYRARDGPITVPTLREELGLSKSSTYNYVDELLDAGLLVELAESQGATRYTAADWTLTIEIDGESLTMGPLTALLVANQTRYASIDRVIEEHGVEALQECIAEARAYDRGETTPRQLAADTGLSNGLAFDVLAAITEIFGFESDEQPMTSADVPDGSVVAAEVDLSELEGGSDPSEDGGADETPIGLMERKRQADEE